MKAYKILQRYPGLPDYFQEGDIIYYYPVEWNLPFNTNPNSESFSSIAYIYKKFLHQQKDPGIWAEDVEKNPDYFMELDLIEIQSEGNTLT